MKKNKREERVSYSNVLLGPKATFMETEAFKTIRTNLLYSSRGGACPVYAVTSSFEHSGKSVVFANLAMTFAQLDKKVLLIDLDMRRPVQHKIFHMPNNCGASEVLAGLEKDLANAIQLTQYENLYLMPSGKIPPNPTELLSSEHMEWMLEEAKKRFDYIFLDLPPVGVVADALIVSEHVVGYVYTVRAEVDDKPTLRECLDKMKLSDAKVLGFILNDVNPETEKKYGKNYKSYRYGGRYGYRYGYHYGSRDDDGEN